jgi:hypothetical protein
MYQPQRRALARMLPTVVLSTELEGLDAHGSINTWRALLALSKQPESS